MERNTLLLAAAGLLHDLGKFAERAGAIAREDPDMVLQEYKYPHGSYTGQTIEKFWGEASMASCDGLDTEVNLYNLAARHHQPRNPYEWIIAEADRLAAGHERARADDASDDVREDAGHTGKSRVPLHSILERISLRDDDSTGSPAALHSRYRLRPLLFGQEQGSTAGPGMEDFFPVPAGDYPADDVANDYKTLWSSFDGEVSGQDTSLSIIDPVAQYESLFHLIKKYTWCVPESTQYQTLPDVSLYDHLKAASALAVCLFQYHTAEETVREDAIRNRTKKKFVLFCGDLSGIQKFIYNVSSKGAYKSLKGRSFFVQLAGELIARFYLEKLGLPVSNILYAGGGKFYLLLPNVPGIQETLAGIDDEINLELFKKFSGQVFLRTGSQTLAGESLAIQTKGDHLCQIWDMLTRSVAQSERKRYARLFSNNYSMFFSPRGPGGVIGSCKVCHEELTGQGQVEGEPDICVSCQQMNDIGTRLRDARYIILVNGQQLLPDEPVTARLLDKNIYILKALPARMPPEATVFCLNNNDFMSVGSDNAFNGAAVAPMMLGGNHRFMDEFEAVAARSTGIKRLGVLRMDVDNLGRVFAEGLVRYRYEDIRSMFDGKEQYQRFNFYSIGRITTLSFQLAFFFGAVVQNILASNQSWKDKAVIVYAGGDDLFLLGAWDVLPDIALKIRDAFGRFACRNPAFTLSGGMVMTGGKFPVYKSAEMAGRAEEAAKDLDLEFGGVSRKKDAFTFLDVPVNWQEFDELYKQKTFLEKIVSDHPGSRGLINRLGQIAGSYQESSRELGKMRLKRDELNRRLAAERWRWRMVYTLSRFGESKNQLRDRITDIQNFIMTPIRESRRTGIELLHVLARWAELSTRN